MTRLAWSGLLLLGVVGVLVWQRASTRQGERNVPTRAGPSAAAQQEDRAPDGTPLEHYAG